MANTPENLINQDGVSTSRVLGLFAKLPEPGLVKTRLAADSSPRWAAKVASAFLMDTLDKLSSVQARRVVAFAPPEAGVYFRENAGDRFNLVPQEEGDLGHRMERFFSHELRAGAQHVVLVGSDSPSLPLDFIDSAFQGLATADVVVGPATDGGYYLVGCAGRLPPIFQEIAWSGSRVLFDTVARLGAAGCRLSVLPPWYDVDTLDDWWMLRGHLAALRRAGIDPGLPRTEQLALHDPE